MARREGDTFIPIEGGTGLRGWEEYPRRTIWMVRHPQLRLVAREEESHAKQCFQFLAF
jgi:hypothetical protein